MLYELVVPWLALASIFLAAVFLGRASCGWACPFGFAQDLLGYLKRQQRQVSLRTHGQMINAKYVVLAITLLVSGTLAVSSAMGAGQGYRQALDAFAPAPFNALSPADTLFSTLPRMALEARYELLFSGRTIWEILGAAVDAASSASLLWARFAVMILVVFLAVNVARGWCRYICPQGAFSALVSRFGFLGLRRDPVRCAKVGCRACVEACPMMVRILDLPWEKFTDPECIYCLRCVYACSTRAIKPRFP